MMSVTKWYLGTLSVGNYLVLNIRAQFEKQGHLAFPVGNGFMD